ncbi:MAG: dUTP diphosphatase [Actinomycetota bacterium]
MLDIPLLRLDDDPDRPLAAPRRIRAGDAAADLPSRHPVELAPGARELVPTGFAVAIPAGHCGLILPRSGLALRHGITVLNAPGLIDSGYRGELKVLLWNTGQESVTLDRGERVAQLLVVAVGASQLTEVAVLPDAPDDRGGAGFGSSGRR